jgi:hypothetical protein
MPGRLTSNQTALDYAPSQSAPLKLVVTVGITASSSGSAPFGTSASFTVSLAGVPPADVQGDSVAFAVDGTALTTVPVSGTGTATMTTPALLPGDHNVTATYLGDSYYPSATTTTKYTVTCPSGSVVGQTVKGNVSTTGFSSFCVINSTIGGSINVAAGTSIAVVNSKALQGALTAKNSAEVMMCGSNMGSGVNVSYSTGLVVIGDSGKLMCPPNTIGSRLALQYNANGVRAIGNTVGNVVANSNSGLDPYGEPTLITGNHP